MRINGNKPKGKNTMKGKKKRKKMQVAPPGFEPAPQLPGPCDHCAIRTLIIILKYFSLPFTLFEPCGAVFIMNSKKQLRKNSLNEYFKAISHYSSFIHSLFRSPFFRFYIFHGKVFQPLVESGTVVFAARCYLPEKYSVICRVIRQHTVNRV